jgi:ubiquinone/menaquinone biosynthesis C-methylase UbiE
MRQADIFLQSEGDNWLERNRDKLGAHDPVDRAITYLSLKPKRVLEIGCANGWRLTALREKFGCEITGIEPSTQAGCEAADRRVPIYRGTAESLPVPDGAFDLVIYGFCLYLTDPADWFRIVAEGDRVLADTGHMIIHDFYYPKAPYAQPYHHCDDVLSYHMNFSALWLAHPGYRRVYGSGGDNNVESVTVLDKFPVFEVRP